MPKTKAYKTAYPIAISQEKEDSTQDCLPKLEQNVKSVTDMLGVLSRPGALWLFILARNELTSHAETYLTIGLSRKQYYTRLSQLIKIGLIEKVGNTYVHTSYGTLICRDYIPRLESAVINPG